MQHNLNYTRLRLIRDQLDAEQAALKSGVWTKQVSTWFKQKILIQALVSKACLSQISEWGDGNAV